jgi:hypothetical protein
MVLLSSATFARRNPTAAATPILVGLVILLSIAIAVGLGYTPPEVNDPMLLS